MNKKITNILLIIAILLIALLSIANTKSVQVSYLLGSFQIPLIILILVCVLLGALTNFLISLPKSFSTKSEHKKLKAELKQLKEKSHSTITDTSKK